MGLAGHCWDDPTGRPRWRRHFRRWVRNQKVGSDEERNPNSTILERYGSAFHGTATGEVDLSRLTGFRALAWDVLGADQGVYENPDTSSYTLANERFLTRDPSDNRSGLFLARLLTVANDGAAATRIRELLSSTTDPWTTLAWPLLTLAEPRLEAGANDPGAEPDADLFALSADGMLHSPTLRRLRTAYDRLAEFENGDGSKLNALRRLVLFGCFVIHVHMCSRWAEIDDQAPRPPIFLDAFDGTRSSLRDASRATLRAASDAVEGLIAARIRQSLPATVGEDEIDSWLAQLDTSDPAVRSRYLAHTQEGQLGGVDSFTEAMLEIGIAANRNHPISFLTELGRRAGYLTPWANAGRGGRLQKRYGVTAEFLEILLGATVEADNPLEFSEFLDAVRDSFGIVVGRWGDDEVIRRNNLRPGQFGMPVSVAEEDLRMNVEALRQALLHTGYAKSYADVAKMSSLQDFEHVTSGGLKQLLVRQVLGAQASANEVQSRWWALLRDDERVSLGQLVDYYAALEPLPEADFIVQASREIHRLGLLPDPALFDNPRAGAIRRRVRDNRELLSRLQTLTEQDRKIIADNIGNEREPTQRTQLARSLRHLRQLRRGGHGLDRLPLQAAQDLLAIRRPTPRPKPTPRPDEQPPPDPTPPPSKQSITEFAAESLLAEPPQEPEDTTAIQQVVDQAQTHLNQLEESAGRPERLEIPLDTGIKLHGEAPLDVINFVGRLIGDGVYGALVQTGSTDIEDMLRRFQGDTDVLKRWDREQFTDLLANFDHPAARKLATLFDAYDQQRTAILPLMRLLCAEPLAVAASPRNREALLEFIARYQALLDHINSAYPALFDTFRSDADDLIAHFLVLETIVLHAEDGALVLTAPTHPLYLWHYAEYCRLVDMQRKDLSPRDHKLVKEAAEKLPNFLTSLCLPNIASEHSVSLPQIGKLGPLPYYGAAPQSSAGNDGVSLVGKLVRSFLDTHPPARSGLRLTLIDPPDAGIYLSMLCDLAEANPPLTGAHLTVLRHPHRKRGVEFRLSADEEDRVARVFHATAEERRFTLDVRHLTSRPSTIPDDVLSHIVVVFDQADGTPRRAVTVAHPIQPLVMRRRLRYRVQAKTVDLEPEAGGIFDAYNHVVAHFDQSAQTSYFAIHQQQATRANLAKMASATAWCLIADRQVDRDLRLARLRVFTGSEGDRDVAAFTASTDPFRRALRQIAQQYNTFISDEQLDELLDELSELLDAGVLALRPDVTGKVDHARVKGMLGTLIAARWYRSTTPQGHHRLLISLDDADARRWLHLRDDALRADLVGIETGNDHATITIFEVKAVQDPSAEFDVKEGVITGPAVEQMLSTRRLLAAVFASNRDNELITTPARREILREHVFRELTKPSYSPEARRTWVPLLERLFDGSSTAELRCQLIDIRLGTDLASLSEPREVRAIEGTEAIPVTIRQLNEAGIDALQQQEPPEKPEEEPPAPEPTGGMPPDAGGKATETAADAPESPAPIAAPAQKPTTAEATDQHVEPTRPRAYLGEGPGRYGRSREVWFDPEFPEQGLPNPHISITGETGSGKTQATKALLHDLRHHDDVPVLVLDFKDDYSQPDYLDSEGFNVHDASLGGLPFNPMIPPIDPQSGLAAPISHIYQLVGIVRRIYKLGDQQAYRLREALKEVYDIQGVGTRPFTPTENQLYLPFESVNDVLRRSKENEALLGRLSTIFDLNLFASSQEDAAFADLVNQSTVIRLSQLPGDEVKNATAEFFLMALYNHLVRLSHPHALRRLLVLDEAWRLVQSPFMEPLMREGRAFGLGVIVATQFPKDLPEAVAGSTATKLYFSQTRSDNIREIQRTIIGKTSGADAEHLAAIVRQMPPLTCLVQNSQYMPYIRTSVEPFFERVVDPANG